MMELLRIDELPYALKVNGILVESLLLRYPYCRADAFEIVITDRQIGLFALTDAFEFETREEGAPWRSITLEQLTKALTESTDYLHVEDRPKASEVAERRLVDRGSDLDVPYRGSSRLGKITGHVECVRRVQMVLFEARIPHRIAGTVFVVASARKARKCLMKAGFRKSAIAPAALIEPYSGCAIQLLEHPGA